MRKNVDEIKIVLYISHISSVPKFMHKNILFKKKKLPKKYFPEAFGVPGGIRTPDLLVRSQSLYPAELQAHHLMT